jgi:hypothetical protein
LITDKKVMLGFDDVASAVSAFLYHFDDTRFFGGVLAMPMDEFRRKVKAADGEMIKAQPMVLFLKGGAGSGGSGLRRVVHTSSRRMAMIPPASHPPS